MVTPSKAPPAKAAAKKLVSAATPVRKKAPPAATGDKATPFVIDAGNLAAFVDHSDSVLPPTAKPIVAPLAPTVPAPVDVAPAAVEVAPAPIETTPVPVPAPDISVEPSLAEINTPTPPQPVVVEKPLVAAIETIAARHTPNALEGHHIMNEAIETGKKFAEDAKARLQTIAGEFNEKAKVAVEKSSKAVEELTEITKGNVEALVESSKIAAKGVESLGQSAAEYGRASFEKTSATLKSFASVKSPVEFFQLQSELFTSAFDTLAAETSKSSEAFLKLAGEIAQPISNRAAIVSDKLKALAA